MGCKDRYMFSKVSSLLDLQYKTTVKLTFSRMCQRKKRKATCDSHKQLAKQLAKFVKATCEATCKIRYEVNFERKATCEEKQHEFCFKRQLHTRITKVISVLELLYSKSVELTLNKLYHQKAARTRITKVSCILELLYNKSVELTLKQLYQRKKRTATRDMLRFLAVL